MSLFPHTSENKKPSLFQEKYIKEQLSQDHLRAERLKNIVSDLGPMKEDCKLSICIPAYRESWIIANTLKHYTLHQIDHTGAPLDPDMFEINILINKPNADTPDDEAMLEEINEFTKTYCKYHINIAQVTYDFPKKPIIGLIFKDIADAVVMRNLSRTSLSEKEKSRLILRTAGADVESLNPLLLSRTLNIFSNSNVVAHRWETRLPPELLQSFPLLHVMQTLAVFLLRQYHGNQTINGPFSYTAEAYSRVWWFNPKKSLWEEIELSKKIWTLTHNIEEQLLFIKDLVKDVLNNPRRQIHSLLHGSGMAGRYQNFWQASHENHLRIVGNDWKSITPENIPDFCLLTCENLSREVSAYYRVYIKIAQANNTPIEDIDIIFMKAFRLSGITEYSFNKGALGSDNSIEIKNIDTLISQMKKQNFAWGKTFRV